MAKVQRERLIAMTDQLSREGKNNTEIAKTLGISRKTVGDYLKRIRAGTLPLKDIFSIQQDIEESRAKEKAEKDLQLKENIKDSVLMLLQKYLDALIERVDGMDDKDLHQGLAVLLEKLK